MAVGDRVRMTRRLVAVLRQQPIALLALFVALGGTSFAAVSAKGSDSNVILGCVGDRSGQLRVVDSATTLRLARDGDLASIARASRARRARAARPADDADARALGQGLRRDATGIRTAAPTARPARRPDGATGRRATGQTAPTALPGQTGPPGADASDTPSELLTALQTVDGTGSGLDADTLDGVHASALLTTSAFGALFGVGSQSAVDVEHQHTGDRFCYVGEIWLTAANYPPPNTGSPTDSRSRSRGHGAVRAARLHLRRDAARPSSSPICASRRQGRPTT